MKETYTQATVAKLLRETTLILIGLFQIYDVQSNLYKATADALGQLFIRHIPDMRFPSGAIDRGPLHTLVDEIERVAGIKRAGRSKP